MKGVEGRRVLITGASSGIGLETARGLAREGWAVTLACRSPERGARAQKEIVQTTGSERVDVLPLDLADLRSVRAAAEDFAGRHASLDVLINNAGLAGRKELTTQGFELTFGVNHLGHFMLTKLLRPLLEATKGARVITVASRAHVLGKLRWDDLQRPARGITGIGAYRTSKLCNILFASELARRAPTLWSAALHPGVVASDIWRDVPEPFRSVSKWFMIPNEAGAQTTLFCATTQNPGPSGRYFARSRPAVPSQRARNAELASELWERSEGWIAPYCASAEA